VDWKRRAQAPKKRARTSKDVAMSMKDVSTFQLKVVRPECEGRTEIWITKS
jgi:hypothetical protein